MQQVGIPARAYRTNAMPASAAGENKLPVDAITFDPGGYFDIAVNKRYNVPSAGYYLVGVTLEVAAAAAGNFNIAQIFHNGSLVSWGQTTYGSGAGFAMLSTCTDTIECNAGDYLEAWFDTVVGLSVPAGSGVSYMSVLPVG